MRTTALAVIVIGGAVFFGCALTREGDKSGLGAGGSGTGGDSSLSTTSATTTTTTTSTSTSTTSTSTSSSSSSGSENCLNGVDDNADQKIDCADPTCTGFMCLDVPAGWSLIAVAESAFGDAPKPCADNSNPTLYFDGAQPAQCNQCQCSVSGATCSLGEMLVYYTDGSCGGAADVVVISKDFKGCAQLPNVPFGGNGGGSGKVSKAPFVVQQGTCMVNGGGLNPSAPFTKQISACATVPSGKGCGAGDCLSASGSPDGKTCIVGDVANACPSGWMLERDAFDTGYQDQRNCDACGCDVGCQGGSFRVDDGNGCQQGPDNSITQDPANCSPLPDLLDHGSGSVYVTVPTATASCNGGGPNGQISGKQSRICCLQ
jgi:hypothetical protein